MPSQPCEDDPAPVIIDGKEHQVHGTARVTVTLEFDIGGGSWGPGTTVDQIYRDGLRQAEEKVLDLWVKHRMRKVGEIKVALVTYPVKK